MLRFEIIIGIICAVICFVVGYRFLKKDKKNAGYIWCGIGVLIIFASILSIATIPVIPISPLGGILADRNFACMLIYHRSI